MKWDKVKDVLVLSKTLGKDRFARDRLMSHFFVAMTMHSGSLPLLCCARSRPEVAGAIEI
jgi:hypothetical protein